MHSQAVFELCAFNLQSAIIGEKAGVARVELCDNAAEGGTTPSYGTIRKTRESISIQLYPIIRPRAGNYYYDAAEMDIIREDIFICKTLGCDGISIGVQRLNGTIDREKMAAIVEWAHPMGVTCNRVFDATPDPFEALEDLVKCGCERILTSGQKSAAPDAADLLARLVEQAGTRIIIMPGAGINASNIQELRSKCKASEYHGSLRTIVPNPPSLSNPHVLDAGAVYLPDEAQLRSIVNTLKQPNPL